MQESKRQKQVARLINEELNMIFQKLGINMIDGGMVSIADVYITPDLLEARIKLSFFQVKDTEAAIKKIVEKGSEIRGILGNKLRHQLRRIPELQFSLDDTLDYVFKMEELFKSINADKNDINTDTENSEEG